MSKLFVSNYINSDSEPFNELDLLTLYPYNDLVLYPLWYENENMKIKLLTSKGNGDCKILRLRFFHGELLNRLPFRTKDGKLASGQLSDKPINLKIDSLIEPTYPETFFPYYELFNNYKPSINTGTMSFIGDAYNQGALEALMFYYENTKSNYQKNIYYNASNPSNSIDLLSQSYKLSTVDNINDIPLSDLIIIDTVPLLSSMFGSSVVSVESIRSALDKLKVNGTMFIRINLNNCDNYEDVLSFAGSFASYHLYRPLAVHPLDSKIILILNEFISLNVSNTLINEQIKSKYDNMKSNWLNTDPVNQVIMPQRIWNKNNGIKLISDLTNDTDLTFIKEPVIEPIDSYELIDSNDPKNITSSGKARSTYDVILQKRSEMNYYKRVMDSLPIMGCNYFVGTNELSNFENLSYSLHPYRRIKSKIVKEYNGELVSVAFVKMYEMLTMDELRIDELIVDDKLKSFSVCEAPGAFVSAINHYCNNRDIKLDWYAQTLAPGRKEALDDRYGLLTAKPKRFFTGDMLLTDTIRSYIDNNKLHNVKLFTGDGGMSYDSNDYNEQEIKSFRLIFAEIVCLLGVLSSNGSGIIKAYLPLAQPMNISMIKYLTCLFEKVYFVKPRGSHCINSELYICTVNYKNKLSATSIEELLTIMDKSDFNYGGSITDISDFLPFYKSTIVKLMNRVIKGLRVHYNFYFNRHSNEKVNNQLFKLKSRMASEGGENWVGQWLKDVGIARNTKRLINK